MAKGGGRTQTLIDSAYDASAVTPNDGTDLPDGPTRAVYVGGAGNLVVDMLGGTTVTFTAVAAGSTLNIQVKRIRSTLTTATAILALY